MQNQTEILDSLINFMQHQMKHNELSDKLAVSINDRVTISCKELDHLIHNICALKVHIRSLNDRITVLESTIQHNGS